jgi:hypothetical protein
MQLNFSAWDEHQTVECRLLPMFYRQSLAVSAVQELVSIYEDFLANAEITHGLAGFEEVCDLSTDENAVTELHPYTRQFDFDLGSFMPINSESSFEVELEEISPPAAGMTRIAVPTGSSITVERLHRAAVARNAAAAQAESTLAA